MMPFNFRHFEPDADLPRLLRLHAEAEAADEEGRRVSEAQLLEQLELPGHDAEQDRWVVESPGDQEELIAFSSVWKAPAEERAEVSGVVHPDWRRKGIGRILLSRALIRARALGATQAGAWADSRNQPGKVFLREHGFLPVAAYTLMCARRGFPFPAATWPAGFSVRSFDTVLDVGLLAQAINSSYDGLWGHDAVTEDEVASQLRDTALDGIFLVFDAGGEVAGMCRAELSQRLSAERGEPIGRIEAPGVIPWRRRQGLYVPLLLTAFNYLRVRQPAAIEMESWGDDDWTLESYQQTGFDLARQSISYRLNLR